MYFFHQEPFPIVHMTMSFLILAMIVTVSMVGFKSVVRTAIPPLAVVSKDGLERGAVRRGIQEKLNVQGALIIIRQKKEEARLGGGLYG